MEKELMKLLLTELNIVPYEDAEDGNYSDDNMVKALTVNENLGSLGYTLKPEDIVRLSISKSCDTIFDDLVQALPDVQAKPMYPDFPSQVMEMDEATFRFHQMLHYFSTYGMEVLYGVQVLKGWLPAVSRTEKVKEDIRLRELSVIELVPERDICKAALQRILGKRERMTAPETRIVEMAVPYISRDEFAGLKVTFKENIEILFDNAFSLDRDSCICLLNAVCQHTGDVLKNIYRILKKNRFHLRSSQKKTFVRLLESFPAGDFRGNLMKSKYGRERNLLVLQKLDYNTYSRSEAHRAVVNELRCDNLRSWESVAKSKLTEHTEDALDYVASRPGTMLRMINWLLNLGYSEAEIGDRLCSGANSFNIQTIVKLMGHYSAMSLESITKVFEKETESIERRHSSLLIANSRDTLECTRDRLINNIRLDSDMRYERKRKYIELYHKKSLYRLSDEGIDKAMNREIEELRDPYQAEIDSLNMRYQEKIEAIRRSLSKKKDSLTAVKYSMSQKQIIRDSMCLYLRQQGLDDKAEEYYESFDISDKRLKSFEKATHKAEKQIEKLESECAACMGALLESIDDEISCELEAVRKKYEDIRSHREEELAELEELYRKNLALAEEEYNRGRAWVEAKVADIVSEYDAKINNIPEVIERLNSERDAKLEACQREFLSSEKKLKNVPSVLRILTRILKIHFEKVNTSVRDKKVYLELDEYDLDHSQILGSSKSSEGGCIPSGIAYKIPNQAKIVRFFVYWNDSTRVDVDLHATAVSGDDKEIHVGWNADFNQNGIVHSGDITHSNAAEYIDINLSKDVKRICTNVSLFSGRPTFNHIAECFVGMMAVNRTGKDVKLYNRANCYFSHEIKSYSRNIYYGYIDVKGRYVKFVGRNDGHGFGNARDEEGMGDEVFSLNDYLKLLFECQNAVVTGDREEADVILTMGKSVHSNGVSLVDENFFMDVV